MTQRDALEVSANLTTWVDVHITAFEIQRIPSDAMDISRNARCGGPIMCECGRSTCLFNCNGQCYHTLAEMSGEAGCIYFEDKDGDEDMIDRSIPQKV